MQKTFLTGTLGKDLELKKSSSGYEFYTTSLAVNNKEGTEWYGVTIKADNKIAKYLKKGHKVLFEGKLSASCYMKDNSPIVSMNINVYAIELFTSKNEATEATEATKQVSHDDDECPF